GYQGLLYLQMPLYDQPLTFSHVGSPLYINEPLPHRTAILQDMIVLPKTQKSGQAYLAASDERPCLIMRLFLARLAGCYLGRSKAFAAKQSPLLSRSF